MDATVLNLIISPEAEVDQIQLNIVTVLLSLTNSSDSKGGFVGMKMFYRKNALAYVQPLF